MKTVFNPLKETLDEYENKQRKLAELLEGTEMAMTKDEVEVSILKDRLSEDARLKSIEKEPSDPGLAERIRLKKLTR